MARNRSTKMMLLLSALALGTSGCFTSSEVEVEASPGLRIQPPPALKQALALDPAFCDTLVADLSIAKNSDSVVAVERFRLQQEAGTCNFTYDPADAHAFVRGEYSFLVRFTAPDYNGIETCNAQGRGDLWVGAYYRDDVVLPLETTAFDSLLEMLGMGRDNARQGVVFTPEDFKWHGDEEDTIQFPGEVASFDPDNDAVDANLAEVLAGSNPCAPNTEPSVSVSVSADQVSERDVVDIDVVAANEDGARFIVEVLIEPDDPTSQVAPIRFRQGVEVAGVTEGAGAATITPEQTADEDKWELSYQGEVTGPGAATWTLSFVTDDPYVGALNIKARALTVTGDVYGDGELSDEAQLEVENIEDPPELLVEQEDGSFVPQDYVAFREVGEGVEPTQVRFKLKSQDAALDVSTLTVEALEEENPVGLELDDDFSLWVATWAPTNDDVLDPDPRDQLLRLRLKKTDGSYVSEEPYDFEVRISPLYNDAPSIDLAGADTGLPTGAFSQKRVYFSFIDPDEASGEPTCSPTVTFTGEGACANPWQQIRCETNGVRSGDTWPMVVVLEPSASYASCGDGAPSFELQIEVADAPPVGAEPNTPKTAGTVEDCYNEDAPCFEHLQLYSADLVSVYDVVGGTLAPGISGANAVTIEGKNKVGIFYADYVDDSASQVLLLDLEASPPTYLAAIPRTEVCTIQEGEEGLDRKPYAVTPDEVNGRLFGLGRSSSAPDACDNDEYVAFVISTANPTDRTVWTKEELSGNAGCLYNSDCVYRASVDESGNIWWPVNGRDATRLVKIDSAGNVERFTITGLDTDDAAYGVSLVTGEDGRRWFVWPDRAAFNVINVETLGPGDNPVTPVASPAGFYAPLVKGARVDPYRGAIYLVYDYGSSNQYAADGVDVELHRIRFDASGPTVDAPIIIPAWDTNNTNGDLYSRFLIKAPEAATSVAEPDLILTGEPETEHRPHVDLDSWTMLAPEDSRPEDDYLYLENSEIFECPLPGYTMGIVGSSTFPGGEGLKLFPWDPDEPMSVAAIPGTTDWTMYYQRDLSCSHLGSLCVLTDSDDTIRVLRFTQ